MSITCPRRLGPSSEEMWARSATPADSVKSVQADTGSTSNPGPFGPRSELTPCQSAVLADLDAGPWRCGVDKLSCPTRSLVRAAAGSTKLLADSEPGPRSFGVNKLSQPTRSRVRPAALSSSCSGLLATWSEEMWCRAAVLADADPGRRSSGVDQLSGPIPSWVRAVVGSTS